jgi:amidase
MPDFPTVPDDIAPLLGALDATGLAALVASGEVTAAELAAAAVGLAEGRGQELGALVHVRGDRAVDAAGDAAPGPFQGVPFLVKDAVCTSAGDPYTAGTRFLAQRGYVAPADTELVRRFRAAGFVVVGTSKAPELATSAVTEPLAHGPARNPWDPSRSPGGSSGGSGAAVAAGIVPVAHGNDMGGSIRIPAALCGLVGLKPTRGRTTPAPRGEVWGPLTHEFVLARSVRDAAGVLDAVAGAVPGDTWTPAPPARDYATEARADPGRLRIGLRTTAPNGTPVDPACAEVARVAARALEAMGHHVEEASPAALDGEGAGRASLVVMAVGVADDVQRLGEAAGEEIPLASLEPWNQRFVEMGRAVTGLELARARDALVVHSRAVLAWWADDAEMGARGYDLLLTPTTASPAPLVGALGPDQPLDVIGAGMAPLVAFTTTFNTTGQPAISLPLGFDAAGVPLGAQLVAAPGRDDLLLQVAAQLEAAAPWAQHRPPTS